MTLSTASVKAQRLKERSPEKRQENCIEELKFVELYMAFHGQTQGTYREVGTIITIVKIISLLLLGLQIQRVP